MTPSSPPSATPRRPWLSLSLLLSLSLSLLAPLCLSACAFSPIKPVQAWEKGILAKPEMSFDADRLDSLLAEHIYTSKEAASGGNGVGGGGCGCN
jgi:hypothetical protein